MGYKAYNTVVIPGIKIIIYYQSTNDYLWGFSPGWGFDQGSAK